MTDEQINEVMRLCDRLAADMQKAVLGASICARADLETYLRTIVSKPTVVMIPSVSAELLSALKESVKSLAGYRREMHCGQPCDAERLAVEAIARAESAIETPAKVSPCAGHAVQLPDPLGLLSCTHSDCGRYEGPRSHECRAMADNACARPSICQGHAVQQETDEARACETCGGRGEVGGFVGGGAPGYETHPCPDCRSGKASLGGLQFKCWRCLDTGFIPKAASLPEPPDVKCPNGCLPKKGGA